MRTTNSIVKKEVVLVFEIADRRYAVPILDVSEIVPMAELSRVPNAPDFLSGFLNVAGRLIAVISLRRLFGMSEHECHLYSPLVILKSGAQQIALEVDAALRISKVTRDELIPIEDTSSLNKCATAITRLDGSPVVLLSVDQLLFEQERLRLAELSHLVALRLDQTELLAT